MKDRIAKTLAMMRTSRFSDDVEIFRRLVADGLDASIAARLVEFVPMAYCRLMLERCGGQFSVNFRRRLADGQVTPEQPLSSVPDWNAIVDFAKSEMDRGISREDLLAVAERSAEFDAINQLTTKGSKLRDLVLSAPVLDRSTVNRD